MTGWQDPIQEVGERRGQAYMIKVDERGKTKRLWRWLARSARKEMVMWRTSKDACIRSLEERGLKPKEVLPLPLPEACHVPSQATQQA